MISRGIATSRWLRSRRWYSAQALAPAAPPAVSAMLVRRSRRAWAIAPVGRVASDPRGRRGGGGAAFERAPDVLRDLGPVAQGVAQGVDAWQLARQRAQAQRQPVLARPVVLAALDVPVIGLELVVPADRDEMG